MKKNDLKFIEESFQYLYSIGADESGGVTRLGYTKNEDIMHGAIRNLAKGLGLKYLSDEVGNSFFYIEDHKEYFAVGSHLDSVVNGGRYDGVAGVISGLLLLKWIKEENLNIPLKVIGFRCEESSSYGLATVGSSLITHKITIEKIKEVKNSDGLSLYDTLAFKGYNPLCKKISGLKGYLELHIEQGRLLEDAGIKIGIVNSIATAIRYWVELTGRQDHSGATPMNKRKDALCGASEIILELEKLGKIEHEKSTVGTVGYLINKPNAFNVIPGEVKIGIDIRGIDWESICSVEEKIIEFIKRVSKERELHMKLVPIWKEKPVKLDEKLKESLKETSRELGFSYMEMNSGAGHDAMKFWDIAPTGLILIPCKEGVSHNKFESVDYEDILIGTKLIFQELKKLMI